MAYNYPIANPCSEIFLPPMPTSREFHVIDTNTTVDSERWYTVVAYTESSKWIRQQHKSQWYEKSVHPFSGHAFSSCVFDIHNELLFLMKLKWAS